MPLLLLFAALLLLQTRAALETLIALRDKVAAADAFCLLPSCFFTAYTNSTPPTIFRHARHGFGRLRRACQIRSAPGANRNCPRTTTPTRNSVISGQSDVIMESSALTF
jgi:hypothetical protein